MTAYSLLASPEVYEDLLSSSPLRVHILALKRALAIMKGDELSEPMRGFYDRTTPIYTTTKLDENNILMFKSMVYLNIKPVCNNPNHFKMLISHDGVWAQESDEPFEIAVPLPLA